MDVGANERVWRSNGTIDVTLSGEVDDSARLMIVQERMVSPSGVMAVPAETLHSAQITRTRRCASTATSDEVIR